MKNESIVTIQHIHQLLPLLPSKEYDSLVLFDIDKTLVIPEIKKNLEDILVEQILQAIAQKPQDLSQPYQLFEKVFLDLVSQYDIKMQPAEEDTVYVVDSVQHSSVCGGITSRFPSLAPFTEKSLKKIGITFNLSNKVKEPLDLAYDPMSILTNGIMFCGLSHSKGSIVKNFLEKTSLKPKSIVLVDDYLDDIIEAQKKLASSQISYIGVHYQTGSTPYDQILSLLKKHMTQNSNS